jgi:hypothetical protein
MTSRTSSPLLVLAAAAVLSLIVTGGYLALAPRGPEQAPSPAKRVEAKPCSVTVDAPRAVRKAVRAAGRGAVVCLAAGSYPGLDLRSINKSGFVVLRGAAGFGSVVDGLLVGGSSYLRVEGLRSTGCVCFREQWPTHHLQFVGNEIGPTGGYGAVAGAGAWSSTGVFGPVHDLLFERNLIHDAGGYGITIGGDGQRVTVRYNRFERVREDYLQSGEPSGWTVDHNWFGPGDFNRPAGYPGHPDVWQTLDSGTGLAFTNNLVRDTNESLGFIFGDMDSKEGFRDIRVANNLFLRPVYGVGETCQFPPTDGFVFERNTLIDARGCRWGSGQGQDWPDASNFTIRNNVLAGNSSLSCNDTSAASSCAAFEAGTSENVSGWSSWRDTTWYEPVGLPADMGARLGPGEFRGFPFGPEPGRSSS